MGALFKVFKSDGITEITNIKSVVYREAVNTGEYLKPGCVSSASVDVEVFNTQANAVSAGDVIYAYVYDNANNGTLLGKFNCEPKIDTKNSYKFTAYDNALKLNADFSQWLQANQSNFPKTVKQLVQQACTIAGVTLGSTSWPLSTQSVQAFYADGITCRDILSYAAELAGRFVRCHTDGKVYFDWYTSNANSIAPSAGTGVYAYKQDGLTYANYTTTALARVAVHPSGEDDVAYIYPTGVTSGNTIHVKNNLLLTGADASFYNAAAQQVYTAVTAVGSYCPMSVQLFPRENVFRAGDIVSITDAQSVTISTPIMSVNLSNSSATLLSEGRENYEDTTETQKAIVQLASDIVRINKLKVGWAEIDNAIVNYLTANDITAQNLTIVDENGTVLATYNASGIVLGQTSEGHAEIDYHAFELYDKDGNVYLYAGSINGNDGKAEIEENLGSPSVSGSYYEYFTQFSIYSFQGVSYNGTQLQPSDYLFLGNRVRIPTSNSYGITETSTITVQYKTSEIVYRFNLGFRKTGSDIGPFSAIVGKNQTASAPYSAAIGGYGNTASGKYAATVGGRENTASGIQSISIGQYSVADHRSQFVFGEYNESDGSSASSTNRGNYVEIVGNGTASNARSNARTLDWSGNEVLAGGLTTGDDVSVTGDITATGALGGTSVSVTGNATVGGDLSVTGDATIGGDLSVSGGFTPSSPIAVANGGTGANNAADALANLGAVAKTGDTMSGELTSTSWFTRKISSAPSVGTLYYGTRFKDKDDVYRGGLAFYRSSTYGDGIRILHAKDVNGNNITNGMVLYIGDSGTPYVAVDQPSAWHKGLGYSAGDSIAFGTTGDALYARFAGDWRNSTDMYFTIPLPRSCVGLTATATGTLYVCSNNTRNYVTLSNQTVTCYTSEVGVTVRVSFATSPSYAVPYMPISVQPYGLTITFS